MRVLVTGAAGRLGRSFRSVLRREPRVAATFTSRQNSRNIHGLDITSYDDVMRCVETVGPEVIVHLAAVTGLACDSDPAGATAVNVESVQHLVKAATELGVSRVIFASSSSVYGDQYSRPVRETDALLGSSTYALMKRDAEQILADACSSSRDLQAIALRIFNVYGPLFTDSLVTKLVKSSAAMPVELAGLDQFVRDYIHADDVASAILGAVELEYRDAFLAINIGNGVPINNRELIRRLSIRADIHYFVKSTIFSYSCADTTVANSQLRFSPARELK